MDDVELDQGTLDFTPVVGVTEVKASLKNTIIPVKYNSLLTGGDVTADALVCTDELPAGTQLYVFQDNKYTGWLLERGAWTPRRSRPPMASAASASEFRPRIRRLPPVRRSGLSSRRSRTI